MRQEPASSGRESRAVLWWVIGIFLLYLATAPAVAHIQGQVASVAPVWIHQAVSPIWSRPVLLLFGLSGVAIALFVPAAAWAVVLAGGRLRAASLFHRAFVLNLAQATAFVSVWKVFADVVPSRPVFIAWQALVAVIGLVVMYRARQTHGVRVHRSRPLLIGGLVLLVLLPALLWGKTFVEDGSGDGTEAFEFSRSLATHQLPYWDLENDHYGFYPQFMLFAYPTQLSFIAIGETEAAQRLPVFFYLLGIFLVLAELARRGRRRLPGNEILLLVGAAAFFLVFHAHHSTYEVISDLAEPTGVDTFFTFLTASAFYALVARQRVYWGIFALCGSMALPAGVPFALLFLLGRMVARWPRLRWRAVRNHLLDAAAFLVPWITYQGLVSIYARFHPFGLTKWAPSRLFDLRFELDPTTAWALVVTFAVVVAVVPLVGLACVSHRDKVVRMLGVPVIGYLAVLVLFGRDHPHYLIPISLFPAAILLRTLAAPTVGLRARTSAHVAYGVMLLVLMIATLPRDRAPHTAYREFGARTLMLYEAYPAAVGAVTWLLQETPDLYGHLGNGKPVLPGPRRAIEDRLMERFTRDPELGPYGLSSHMWIRYADRAPVESRDYDQVLAAVHLAPPQPEGFLRHDLPEGWVLFYHPKRSIFDPRGLLLTNE